MEELAVMDYSTGEIFIYPIKEDMETEEIEQFLHEKMGFTLDEVYYMVAPRIAIHKL